MGLIPEQTLFGTGFSRMRKDQTTLIPFLMLLSMLLTKGSCNQEMCVGTLKDGYVCNVPLPWVPRIQSAKLIAPSRCILEGTAPSRCIQVGTPLPDYLPISSWIPTLLKLGSILGFSQRILWSFSPIAIKAKNNILSSAHGLFESLEQSTVLSEQKTRLPPCACNH